MKHLDLFSGIGGFALAAGWAGFRTIGFSEINPYASQVLKRHWPNVKNYGDIKNIKGSDLPAIDLITGGFPCQPFSVAGKRRGKEDDRHLWPEMLRVIQECKPTWVLGENVAGIVNMELESVLSDLEGLGYEVQPVIIPACAVDSCPHRRDRVWIIAHSKCQGRKRYIENGGLSSSKIETCPKPRNGIIQSWDELGKCRGGLRESDGLRVQMVRNQVHSFGNAIVPAVAYEILRLMA